MRYAERNEAKRAEYQAQIAEIPKELFVLWFRDALLKEVSPGCFIVLDNATFHRKKALTVLAENAGCSVIFLPPYSPDFNPIENDWANLKTFIRNYGSNFRFLSLALAHYFKVV